MRTLTKEYSKINRRKISISLIWLVLSNKGLINSNNRSKMKRTKKVKNTTKFNKFISSLMMMHKL